LIEGSGHAGHNPGTPRPWDVPAPAVLAQAQGGWRAHTPRTGPLRTPDGLAQVVVVASVVAIGVALAGANRKAAGLLSGIGDYSAQPPI